MSKIIAVMKHYNLPIQEGNTFKIVCPFHADVNPSMLIDIVKDTWMCFGCNEGGDCISLIKKIEKCNDLQATHQFVKITKGIAGTSKKYLAKLYKHERKIKNDEWLAAYNYYTNLSRTDWYDSSEVSLYLLKRGIKLSSLELVNAKLSHNVHYPVVFSLNENGTFKGWVSRTISKEIEAKRKYLYNKGFRRISTLHGCWNKNPDYLIITEGYFDWLKAVQFGENNVVALLGWKASDNHLEKIKKINPKIIIVATDNDEKGKMGYKFLKEKLGDFKVKRFKFPKDVKDLGEMSKKQFIAAKQNTLKPGGK